MTKIAQNKPLVSIVIPCYNHENYVQESIQGVIDQNYENIELIIIDDGSSDGSVRKIKEMIPACEMRFRRFEFRHRSNKGLCATLNEALEWCAGEFFSPIASDDIVLSHKTDFLVKKHSELNAAVIFGSAIQFDEQAKCSEILRQGPHSFEDMFFLKYMPIAPASMMRREDIVRVGGFSEDVRLEDLYMWLVLTSNDKKLFSFPNIVVKYRNHDTNTVKNEKQMHLARLKVFEKFSSHPSYSKAIRNACVVAARGLANQEILYPIRLLLQYGEINKRSIFILIKSLTPAFILTYVKYIISQRF